MQEALDQLVHYFRENPHGILLFSGGYDSSCLLGASIKAQADIIPFWIDNGFNRCNEAEIRQQAENLGAKHFQSVIVAPATNVCINPTDRCYHCKNQIITTLKEKGAILIDGTTISDTTKYRPGAKALQENGVISPLKLLGITQQQTRQLAIEMGADPKIAQKESCMATRFNYGQLISKERLATIREIEELFINKVGDYDVRCRFDDLDHIRIELASERSFEAIAQSSIRQQITEIGSRVALFSTIDLTASRPNEYDNRLKL